VAPCEAAASSGANPAAEKQSRPARDVVAGGEQVADAAQAFHVAGADGGAELGLADGEDSAAGVQGDDVHLVPGAAAGVVDDGAADSRWPAAEGLGAGVGGGPPAAQVFEVWAEHLAAEPFLESAQTARSGSASRVISPTSSSTVSGWLMVSAGRPM
jgi:hypothetical protein